MPEITITDESAALLHELWVGMRTVHDDPRREQDLVDDAIRRVHRGFFGLPNGSEGGPDRPTGPFRKWASDRWAEVLLRQVDARQFRLSQPFRYDDGSRRFEVPEDDVTDLASVPRFLTWLVPRYGRHTLAALLHDHLQDVASVRSEEADAIFRDAMGDTDVPLLRRWLMWSAVALRTQWNLGGWRRERALVWVLVFGLAALVLWPLVTLTLVFAFGWDAVLFAAVAVVLSVVAPVVCSALWGRRWRIGALSGAALMFFTLQIVLVIVALVAYVAVEWSAEHLFVRKSGRNPVLTRNLS